MLTRDHPIALLVDGRYADYEAERIAVETAGGELRLNPGHPVTEDGVLAVPGLSEASVLLVELSPITRAVLEAATSCRAVVRYGTGADNVDVEAANQLGIRVETVPAYAAESVSEHAMTLLLAIHRRLVPHLQLVHDGDWRQGDEELRPVGLAGRSLGIIGMGAIGRALAVRARAFGMTIVAHDPIASGPELDALARMDSLDAVLAAADVLSLHLPLLPSTAGMIDDHALSSVREGAVLINTSRGGLIDEDAVLRALDNGTLSYAGLDVALEEPLPQDHPFRNHPRVLMTPHIGFWSDRAELALRSAVAGHAAVAIREELEHGQQRD
jgi:D-3-phosphoglycerate dehydrogenase